MRLVFVMVVSLVAGCAFEPGGPGVVADDDTDAAIDPDSNAVTDPDATPDTDADVSTLPDADILPLPDAHIPQPDASPPIDAAMPIDAPNPTENACSNGDDDDHDGSTDCRDDDCPSCTGLLSCCGSGACALICL